MAVATKKKGIPKRLLKMSQDELREFIRVNEAINEQTRKKIAEVEAQVRENDPFWYYEPSTGEIDTAAKAFLAEFLKPDDIPVKVWGQKDFHLCAADIRGVAGGNQSGKSTALAISDFIQATGALPYSLKGIYPKEKLPRKWPQNIRVVGVDFKQLHNTVLPRYRQWCPKDFLKAGSWEQSFSSQHNRLELYKDGKVIAQIEFMTNEQDVESFQGPPLDKVSFDEECDHRIWKENMMRFTTAEKLNVEMAWTPTKGLTWSYDLFLKSETESGDKIECFKLPSVTNQKANLKVLRQILSEMSSYDEVKMRLLGEFISLSGLIYGGIFDRKAHVIEPFEVACGCLQNPHRHECPAKHYLVLRGIDPHLVKPTACVWVAVNREGICYVCESYQEEANTERVKSDIHALSDKMRLGPMVMDQSANCDVEAFDGANIYKLLTRGKHAMSNVRLSIKHQGSVKAGVDVIKRYLGADSIMGRPRLYFMDKPTIRPLIEQMMTLERDTYANEDKKGQRDRIQEGRHDLHAALRYCFQYPIRWHAEVDVVPQPVYFDEALLA